MTGFRSSWGDRAKWPLGGLLVLDLAVLLFVLSLANVTAEGPAQRSLGQSVAILTEIDAFLDDHLETLRLEAEQAEAAAVVLPDFPVQVSLSTEEILTSDREEFRSLLLARSAERIHEDGVAIFQEDRGAEISFFSPQGALRSGMDFLRPTPHRVLMRLTIALGALAALLTLGLALASRGYGRLLALGLSIFLAATPFLILAVAVRFAFRLAADGLDDYFASEFLELGQDLTWAPVRNGIIFTIGGGVMLVAGAVLTHWSDSRLRI